MTTYRLPDFLGGLEVTLREEDQSAWGDVVRVWAKAGEDEAALVEIRRGLLVEVEPPLPDEWPDGSIARDGVGNTWRRFGPAWRMLGSDLAADWPSLNAMYGPLTRLVPDPAKGVELPLHLSDPYSRQVVVVRACTAEWGAPEDPDSPEGTGRTAAWVTAGNQHVGSHINADSCRSMAGALLAAADAAEAVRDER